MHNERCVIEDPDFVEKIWQQILREVHGLADTTQRQLVLDFLSQVAGDPWLPAGLNEYMRINRGYVPGQFFLPHSDRSYVRNTPDAAGPDRQGERSFVACLVYLNDCPAGGETAFHVGYKRNILRIPCRTATLVLFDHGLIHEGCPILEGQKFVMRTDVMYTNKGPGNEYSKTPIVSPSPI